MAFSSLRSFLLLVASTIFTTTFAAPIPTPSQTTFIEQIPPHSLSKRGQSARKIGINLCITISVIVCAALFFYLGMRKSKHPGTWLCFRLPSPKNLPKPAKLVSWPWILKQDWAWRSKSWPWQRIPTPVFELEAKEARRRTLRRSWLRERMRHEEAEGGQRTNVDTSPLTPMARSRDQIRAARQQEIEGRGRTEAQRQEVERRGRTEEERRIIQQRLDVDLNVYEMGSSASHRSPSPRPTTSGSGSGSAQSKPQTWFQQWRYYFEQPPSADPDQKREYRLTQTSVPRRWYSVKSAKSVKSTMSRKSSTRKHEQNMQSRWSKSTTNSVYELDGQAMSPPPAYPEKAHWGRLSREKREGGMDWRGAEFVKKTCEKRLSSWRA